jgi:hypothetical protein
MTTTLEATALRYVPISIEIAERARRTLRDDFGHELEAFTTQAPCRVCLRISTQPERLILLSYRPLSDLNPYAEVGPIFIHERDCVPYDAAMFPPDFQTRRLVIRAYDARGFIHDAIVAAPGEGERIAAAFLALPQVAEVHVRHDSYTCFDFAIVRAGRPNDS